MANLLRGLRGNRGQTVSKQLGVNVGVIVTNLLKKENSGFVDKTEFNYFWAAMQDGSQDCNVFLHLLINNLLAYLIKNKQLPFSPQVILNTINFLTLRHQLPPSKQVQDILKRWKKKKDSYDDPSVPSVKDVLGILYKRLVENSEALDKLVIQCHQFYNHQELERIADYYENPTIVDILSKDSGRKGLGLKSGDKVCVWSFLKDSSHDKQHLKLIISSTLSKFMSIKGQILLSPKLAEISLLALIFMLRLLISYNRVPDEQFLERSIAPLKQFYLWPIPYGSQARDLLLLLKKERVAPGFALIQKVWKECHLPEIVLNQEESFRPLYYLFDIHDRDAILVSNVMRIDTQTDWGSEYEVHTGVSPRTCALLMLNIISHDCGIDNNRLLENAIRNLNEHEVILFYKEVIDVFTKSSETNDIRLAKEKRKQGLNHLQAQIIDHSKSKKEDKIESEDDLVELNDIPDDYRVTLPELHHTGIACDLTKEQFPDQGQMAAAEVTYPVNNVLEKMRNILTQLSKLATEKDPITLRFVIAGGNPVLNATITAYASLRRHGQALMNKFNLEFMVIPYSLNHFAEWLARQDPWYQRHIYLPLQSQLYITPSLQPDTKPKLSSTGKLHTVGEFYREMSESYAHEADEVIPLMLWECHCWTEKPFTQTPKQLIPFCQRVVLGKDAEFVGQQILYSQADDDDDESDSEQKQDSTIGNYVDDVKVPDGDNDDENDIEADTFVFQPFPLDVEWQSVDMIGKPNNIILQKQQFLTSLTISSCPRYGDKGFPASPCNEGVAQMYADLSDASRKRKFQEYGLFKNEPSQHIRTTTITTSDMDNKFWVQVDDRTYGPFVRVKIQPMVDPMTKKQVAMPIKCFFPIDHDY